MSVGVWCVTDLRLGDEATVRKAIAGPEGRCRREACCTRASVYTVRGVPVRECACTGDLRYARGGLLPTRPHSSATYAMPTQRRQVTAAVRPLLSLLEIRS